MRDLSHWLARVWMQAAAGRLRDRHPDWAEAMVSEHASLSGQDGQLDWAFGSLTASAALELAAYPVVLALAVAAMGIYQWSADESPVTLIVLTVLALALGFLRPSRFLISGIVIGVVVCVVNTFETFSGVRPGYELYGHSWVHNLRWLALIVPALVSSALGRQLSLRFLA